MRLSRFFLPLLKETPSEAQIVSHRFMLRAGMIRQVGAGIYNWLPLGHRVLRKVEQIVREEMDRAGAVELLMPTMQPADLWRESGRYDDYGKEMLRITDRSERDMLFGPTAEEVVTDIFRTFVKSYKALPLNLYNIQWKFRDEVRPRFGVMRGREFLMKDAYSFDLDEAGARLSYDRMFIAYMRAFSRMGLNAIPMRADTGPIGGDLSHEFIVLADTGESEVYLHESWLQAKHHEFNDADFYTKEDVVTRIQHWVNVLKAEYAATSEMRDIEYEKKLGGLLKSRRGIEVGQIFYFGTKYSAPMKASVAGPEGKEVVVHGGSYGIGVSRLLGAIIEASHDDNGIIWPEEVAPFKVGLVNIRVGDAACDALAQKLYDTMGAKGVEVLYDDTAESAGKKFASMDLIGLPWQVVVGPKGVAAGVVELKNRRTGEKLELSPEACIAKVSV